MCFRLVVANVAFDLLTKRNMHQFESLYRLLLLLTYIGEKLLQKYDNFVVMIPNANIKIPSNYQYQLNKYQSL